MIVPQLYIGSINYNKSLISLHECISITGFYTLHEQTYLPYQGNAINASLRALARALKP